MISPPVLTVTLARPDDLPAILALFDAAVIWLAARGLAGQWGTTPFSALPAFQARIAGWIAAGTLGVARQEGAVVGALAANPQPPAYIAAHWPSWPTTAAYLEAFVTTRSAAGQGVGAALLVWAATTIAARGGSDLWLDCWADNVALCAYYVAAGFTPVASFTVGAWRGQLFHRALST